MKNNAKNNSIKKNIVTISLIALVAICIGFLSGNLISNTAFPIDNYSNINGDDLRDDVSSISISNKKPTDFSGAIAFQIAEQILLSSTDYEVIGIGTIETSLGVSQTSYTKDIRHGDNLYIGFTTYSSFVKASKESHYKIGEDIILVDGTPKDSSLDNVQWGKSKTYTWEGYKESFGKYANRNCCYVVSTKTTVSDSGFSFNNGLYECTLTLNPTLAGSNYAKQVGTNMGVDYKKVVFNEIKFTFFLDENFKFVKQIKYESYTVPYMGIDLTLNAQIETNFNIT